MRFCIQNENSKREYITTQFLRGKYTTIPFQREKYTTIPYRREKYTSIPCHSFSKHWFSLFYTCSSYSLFICLCISGIFCKMFCPIYWPELSAFPIICTFVEQNRIVLSFFFLSKILTICWQVCHALSISVREKDIILKFYFSVYRKQNYSWHCFPLDNFCPIDYPKHIFLFIS